MYVIVIMLILSAHTGRQGSKIKEMEQNSGARIKVYSLYIHIVDVLM